MNHKKSASLVLCILFVFNILFLQPVKAEEGVWPEAPEITGKSAILIDANSGAVLYEKAADARMYPASITKVLTALLAIENSKLGDMVTFSDTAINSLPYDAAKVGMVPGEQVSLMDCLYGLILRSGNEIANALAEHVSGSIEGFVELMNQYAEKVGADNTHFVNPSGLHNDEHYTTARDYSRIVMEAVKNDILSKVMGTDKYTMSLTNKNEKSYNIWHRHSMMVNVRQEYYDKALGGKTGYTGQAGNTLVTIAKDGDLTLICVVLGSNADVYNDTRSLFEYGFRNFTKVTITDDALKGEKGGEDFFSVYSNIFDKSQELLSFDRGDIIIPKGMSVDDVEKRIEYVDNAKKDGVIAKVGFYYNTLYLGETEIMLKSEGNGDTVGPAIKEEIETEVQTEETMLINVKYVYAAAAVLGGLIITIILLRLTKDKRRTRRDWTKRYKKRRFRR